MATILKCKMCGGDIETSGDMTIGTCLYCGSTMTLPRIDSDRKARLFNRANEYRLNNEFDKALEAYKTILQEDEGEAEAYWGLLLSEYGIEYVEDPKTKRRILTCHRTHMQPISQSSNFKLACKYADAERKLIYQDEAELIDKIQKQIIAISSKEQPYDVFICYKENDDETGERTETSILAQNIYEELTEQGIRTFFSRISLEDKLGQEYEPYIYSALQSAKVMLMVTTKPEYCDAVWVKNEWSRYIAFMQEDRTKSFIPVYDKMTSYELPNEFQRFQAQDMSKIGAQQDLIRGIKKLLKIETKVVGSDAIAIAFGAYAYYINVFIPKQEYNAAVELMDNKSYDEALEYFESHLTYKDSTEYYIQCYRILASNAIEEERFKLAQNILSKLEDMSVDCKDLYYMCAKKY